MTPLAHLAMFGIVPLVFALFAVLDARRAVLASFVIAWLFLPVAGYHLPGLPDYDKVAATTVPVFVAIALFDMRRLLSFQPGLYDVPILVWCLAPFLASITNQLGAYDGMAGLVEHVIGYGIPWLVGRLYFSTPQHMKQLAIAVAIGGLLYVPLAFWEARMSPQLHNILYGFHQHTFHQHIRGLFHRPMVFLQHGLAVSLWLCMATVTVMVLWHSGAARRLMWMPMWVAFSGLAAATVLSGSLGPMMLFAFAVGVYAAVRVLPPRPIVLVSMIAVPVFLAARVSGVLTGELLVRFFEPIAPEARIASLQVRLDAENALRDHAMSRPLFGWGGFGRSRVSEAGTEVNVLDSMWIITLGRYGLVGLASYLALILIPAMVLVQRVPAGVLRTVRGAPLLAVALVLVIFVYDNMVNAMANPIVLLAAAGLLSTALAYAPSRAVNARRTTRVSGDQFPGVKPA